MRAAAIDMTGSAIQTRRMAPQRRGCLAAMFSFLLAGMCANAESYPAPAPIKRIFDVSDVSKANVSLHIKGRDGRDLYTLQCHSAGYEEDSSFDYSGDFECRLSLSGGRNIYSTLLTEDLNQSRDWESRGRFFAANLKGECARVPEFGDIRNFRLRGMRLTLRILDPVFRANKLYSLKVAVSVFPDPNAHRAIADVVPLPKSGVPESCKLAVYFTDTAAGPLSPGQQSQQASVNITTSDAIDLARAIASDEGYDVKRSSVYSFELLLGKEGEPFLRGYTSIGFNINGGARNLLVIDNTTGQVADFNTCEVFDYPNVRGFQQQILHLSGAQRKTPQEIADDVGCDSPKVLNQPIKRRDPR